MVYLYIRCMIYKNKKGIVPISQENETQLFISLHTNIFI